MSPRNRTLRSVAAAAFVAVPLFVLGCADPETNRTPGDNYGSANYRNDQTINNTTDPGSIRAEDRGIPQSATTGKRDEGLGWGVSGGDR